MAYDVVRCLPNSGDTRYRGTSDAGRAPSDVAIRQVAETADRLGYDDVPKRVFHRHAERLLRLT